MFALRYLVAIACLLKGVTASGDPLDALATKSSLSGTFTQSIVSPEGLLLEQAEGRFQLLRPDYFWWRIQVPDQQLLVAVDGQLTQIDWDLEVVTRRDFSPQDRTVLQWLLASRDEIERAFTVERRGQLLKLAARETDAPVVDLTIEYSRDTSLWRLTMTDRGGQVIKLALKEELDRSLSPEDFSLPTIHFD